MTRLFVGITQVVKEAYQISNRCVVFVRSERPAGNLRERPTPEGKLGDIVNSTPTYYAEPSRTRRNGLSFPQTTNYTYAEFAADNASRQGISASWDLAQQWLSSNAITLNNYNL